MQAPTAFYAGSFDPITNGHLDVLKGVLSIASRVVVGVGVHPSKKPVFEVHERVKLIRDAARAAFGDAMERVEVSTFDGLAVHAARAAGATLVVRGIRDGSDLDDEMRMAGMNSAMAPDLPTVFLPAGAAARMITGTLVRQIAAMGGDVWPFVPPLVAAALEAKFAKRSSKGPMS